MSPGRDDWWQEREGESRKQRELRLRQWLGGQLRQPGRTVPDSLWDHLVEAGLVRDLLDDGQIESSPEDFLKAARAFPAQDRANNHRVRQKERGRAGRQLTAEEAAEGGDDIGIGRGH